MADYAKQTQFQNTRPDKSPVNAEAYDNQTIHVHKKANPIKPDSNPAKPNSKPRFSPNSPKQSQSLGLRLIETARHNRHKKCICDSTGRSLTYGQTLTAAAALAAKIEKLNKNEDKLGIMLPPSVAAALANFAAVLARKVPVNINYLTAKQHLESAINHCHIRSVITSRKLLEKIPPSPACEQLLFIEDIIKSFTIRDKLKAYILSRFAPGKLIKKAHKKSPDELATIIFSSGSCGTVKGIMLSHKNILANIDSLLNVFDLKQTDCLCGVLPFFHSFGFRPVEGYGATELSPVVSLNLPQHLHKTGQSHSFRENTVGRPIPGVHVRIVCPETGNTLEAGQPGLIHIKGPTVMIGYLQMPQQTAEVIKDGWYNTGDIGFLDQDGFLTITDRLARFSKIAGEMVPHIHIEDTLHSALNADEQIIAVTGIPHEKKGEELVVLYIRQAANAQSLHDITSKSNLPNSWKPRPENFIPVDSIPRLASGKLDLANLRKIAANEKLKNS